MLGRFLGSDLVGGISFGIRGLVFLLRIFFGIFVLNFVSLLPFVFTMTAHPSFSFPFAFSCWFRINLYGWVKFLPQMLEHLVPQGTPFALMNFMVLIELVRNLIRPITLSVRLTANMSAGHLLMRLLGGAASSLRVGSIFVSLVGIFLTLLELGVSFIQGYVFMTLFRLYVGEVS